MTRPSKDEYYMGISEAVSRRSTCLRAHCGSVIVKDDVIVATGYNGNPRSMKNCCDIGICPRAEYKPQEGTHLCNAVHSEMNALLSAGRDRTIGAIMYVWFKREDDSRNTYHKPCDNCWKHILNSGIITVVNYTEDKYHITKDITFIKNDGSGEWETINLEEIIK